MTLKQKVCRILYILAPVLLYMLAEGLAAQGIAMLEQDPALPWHFPASPGDRALLGLAAGSAAGALSIMPMALPEIKKHEGNAGAPVGRAAGRPVVFALSTVCFALFMNTLLSLAGSGEAGYAEGSGLLTGLAVYGLLTPFCEELLFRGTVYGRLRTDLGPRSAAALSGALFGIWHGNLTQGIYGALMGFLFAVAYEKSAHFAVPFLLHAGVNALFLLLMAGGTYEGLCSPAFCGVFLLLSAAGFFGLYRTRKSGRF
jgi:membrane protease YdiL (CAAX protease family)